MGKLFEKTELLDTLKHRNLRWHCLGGNCPSSCCYVPHRSSIILDEAVELSHYFPLLFFVVEREGKRQREFGIVFKHEQAKKCVYLEHGMGCTLGDKKPLACKQYPFQIVKDNKGLNLVMLDLTCPGFSEETGEELFVENGRLNPFFEANFLQASKFMVEKAREAQVFTETMFNYNLIIGGKFVYKNIEVQINYIDENRLFELPKEVLKDFKTRGYIRYIYAHINSLPNIRKLIDDYLKETNPTEVGEGEKSVYVFTSREKL